MRSSSQPVGADTVLHHVSLPVSDLDRSAQLYDAALAGLGYRLECSGGDFAGYRVEDGKAKFAIKQIRPAACAGPRFHLSFATPSRESVGRFHAAALRHGPTDDGGPGLRRRVIGESVTEREGQREHPLPHRDLGQHPLDHSAQPCPPCAGRRTTGRSPALAGKGDDAVESAPFAMHAHEAVGQDPAAQEAPKLALDEARHRALAGLGPSDEGLEFRPDHPVERARGRALAAIVRGEGQRLGRQAGSFAMTRSAKPSMASRFCDSVERGPMV